jgi:hypothetical protein
MLPRWFRIVLVVDLALVAAVAVLGARLALDGAHAAGRMITWDRTGPAPAPPATTETTPPAASASTPGPLPAGPRLDASLLHRLDADAASTTTAQRGLLGRIEVMIRTRIVGILEHAQQGRSGG